MHSNVKQALARDGWIITDDPCVISYSERLLLVDPPDSERVHWMRGQL